MFTVSDPVVDPGVVVGAPVDPGVVVSLAEFKCLRGYQRDVAFMRVERELRRLHSVQAAMVAEVNASVSFVDDGHHSPVGWVQAVTNSSRSTANYVVGVASLLAALPVLAAAVAAGGVGDDQLRLLTKLYSNPRCRHLLTDSEDLLVGYACTLTLREFALVCQRWLAHADPDGAHRDHETSRTNRGVSNTRVGAGHKLCAEGDALSGDIINTILDAHTQTELEIDITERFAVYGDLANQHPLARTARQRRYDAMLTIFLTANNTNSAQGAGAGNKVPLINIITNEHTLTTVINNYYANPNPQHQADPPTPDRLWMCHTTSGAPVDPTDLIVAALIGQIRRVIVDSAGRVIDLGRRSRLFTNGAREAVLLTDNQCCWPGCNHPNVEIDHLQPWARANGTTTPLNGAPLCPRHNRHKHNHHTTITRNHTGWHHHRPNGTEIAPRTNDQDYP